MKKLLPIFYAAPLLFFISFAFASTSSTGSLHIDQVTSNTGYYSVKIYSKYPSNRYEVKGISTKLPYLLSAINRFIAKNLQNDKTAYIEFGYSDGQDTNSWFTTGPCRINLPDDKNISVTIQSKNSCAVAVNAK